MSAFTRWLDRHAYPQHGNNWDNELFADEVLAALPAGGRVLDLGAGAGIVEEFNFRGRAAWVCGVDLDPRVTRNPFLDEGRVGAAEQIPYDDAAFELVFSNNVLEHLPDPIAAFREVRRVLAPGGRFLVKTPNRRHYVPLLARLTSHRVHEVVNRWRGRRVEDTFPTLYRVNTPGELKRTAQAAGLRLDTVRLIEGRPEYLRLFAPAYLAGIAYERVVNATDFLAGLRVVMIGAMTKPGA
jgi:SAM-dependent methyltransferase